jgi:hypothetical protein
MEYHATDGVHIQMGPTARQLLLLIFISQHNSRAISFKFISDHDSQLL